MVYYDFENIFSNENVLKYCEKVGIISVYSRKNDEIVYYSYFGNEGYYKVTKNVVTGAETRKHLNKKPNAEYNYFCG